MKLIVEFVDDEDLFWFIELIQRLGLEPKLKTPEGEE